MPDYDYDGIEMELNTLTDETSDDDYKAKYEKMKAEKENLLKALHKERETKKKPAAKEETTSDDDFSAELEGYDDDTKKLFNKFTEFVKNATRPLTLDMQISQLKAEIPDIDMYAVQVKDYSTKHNVPIEDAYWALRGKELTKKSKEDIELEVANRMKNQPDNIDFSASASAVIGTKAKLTQDHIEMAQQKGIDLERYALMKNAYNTKEGIELSEVLNSKK